MGAARDGDPHELVARLARLLTERQDLLHQVERIVAGEGAAAPKLYARLEAITREQQALIAALQALVPPDERDLPDPPPDGSEGPHSAGLRRAAVS
jgi:hypothetical protein